MSANRTEKDSQPSRRKDKNNPYRLFNIGIDTDDTHYFVSFKDAHGADICVEINKEIYKLFDKFELEDLSFMNEWDRHTEHSELTDESLNKRAVKQSESTEDIVSKRVLNSELHRAINLLPEKQRRRLILYYFGELTYEAIAEREGCKHTAIIKSVKSAITKLKKYFSV